MYSRLHTHKKKTRIETPEYLTAPAQGMFQSRPFVVQPKAVESQQPELKTSLRRAKRYGFTLNQIKPITPAQTEAPQILQAKLNSEAAGDKSESSNSRKRVTEPVPGLFDSIDPQKTRLGTWNFQNKFETEPSGVRVVTTVVTHKYKGQKTQGRFVRAIDPTKQQIEMREAFLGDLPSKIDVEKLDENNLVPLVKGMGIPTVTYITLYQMKLLNRKLSQANSQGVGYGEVNTVKMSTIENLLAILQLNQCLKQGEDINEAVLKTHSVKYAETAIIQSGHRIVRAEVIGGKSSPISEKLSHYETRNQNSAQKHDKLLNEYGVKRGDKLLWGYDIYLTLEPWSKK